MKVRKVPMRLCAGCGASRPKRELVRVVRAPDGAVSLDFTGRKPGRGAYICPDAQCVNKARKNKRLSKSFECAVPDEIYDGLLKELSERSGERQEERR